ncbi:MAG: hypothetical protein ACI39R_06895 [Lachnospiraceae bacterium]
MKEIIDSYYADNAQRLRNTVDKILFQLRFEVDHEDFYSLANEVFAETINRYDGKQSFDGFLYSCLVNQFKTEMTRRNRQKRQADGMTISIDMIVGGEDNTALGDFLVGMKSVEEEIIDKEEVYSEKMVQYLGRLSDLQKNVLFLTAKGYSPGEIKEKLQISNTRYRDCREAIHSYRNVSLLF